MVCKECGAYNADHLTHCRVCATKLRDTEPVADAEDQTIDMQQDDVHPARGFVSAPSWPTRAYTGAPDTPAATPAQPAPQPSVQPAPQPVYSAYTPVSSAVRSTATYAAQSVQSVQPVQPVQAASMCPNCGKPALPGAPFCPYCGTNLVAAAPAPAAAPRAAAAVAAAAPVRTKGTSQRPQQTVPQPMDTMYDDDDDDAFDDDEEDVKPAKKKAAASKKKAKPKKKSRYEDDFDDEDEFDDDEEDEFDDEYDDDEFDDDDDDMPKKRGKGTTLLFIGLIVLLVALVVVFGMYLIKKNGGGEGGLMSSISTIFGSKKTTEDETAAGEDAETATATITEDNMFTASIGGEYTDPTTGDLFYDINIYAPTGSTVHIVTNATLDSDTATVPSNDHVVLRVARDVFMPNAPCDSEQVIITPNISVDTPDGQTVQLKADDITVNVPSLSLTLEQPASDTLQQTFANDSIVISGQTDDHTVEVFINDQPVTVYEGGVFTTTYAPQRPVQGAAATTGATADGTAAAVAGAAADDAAADDAAADDAATDDAATDDAATDDAATDDAATDDTATDNAATDDAATDDAAAADDAAATDDAAAGAVTAPAEATPIVTTGGAYPTDADGNELIVIEARKNNYVTARKVITIQPYVIQNMTLLVTNDVTIDVSTGDDHGDLAASDGNITVNGTVSYAADTKIIATCDSPDVTFGEPSLTNTGAFTMQVSVGKVGVYEVELDSTATGFNPNYVTFFAERYPTDKEKSAFQKKCASIGKSLDKIKSGEIKDGSFTATGKVTEIVSQTPYSIFKLAMSDGNEIICYNRSSKSTINSSRINDKKIVYGTLFGTYEETGLPLLWCWYIKNA